MEQYADELAELLDALGIDEPIVLVGFSMGGYIAWQFVRKYAERLRALDPVRHAGRGRYRGSPRRPDQDGRERRRMGQRPRGRDDGAETVFGPRTSKPSRELMAAVRRVVEHTPPAAIAAAQRGMAARPDVTACCRRFSVPTLVLVGAADAISPPAEMQAIADAIPDAEFVEIPDAGHMTTMENPAAVNATMERFLKAVSS